MARANTLAVSRKQVAAIVAATFPEYRGRKISVVAAAGVLIHDLNWSYGSRNQYRACTLDGQSTGDLDPARIPLGVVVVCLTTSQGRGAGLTITVNEGDFAYFLPDRVTPA